ncbi:unnamed protein product [Thlaspi arvense]|uniref:Serine aminopeptidase S33 domain-containing protein n=1 Tax=Thlaspi arvense TaxID=13288 RepID=A0AAU9T7K1_THLAR|nr:unnamed protein product [Thlaspi arvense]
MNFFCTQASEKEDIKYEESFIKNTRGMKLFTCKWLRANQEPKALVFICHGYAMECSITMNSTARRLVKVGFGVYGMDCEGHGKSDGLSAYVPNFDHLVDDVSAHYTSICGNVDFLYMVLLECLSFENGGRGLTVTLY